MTLTPPQEVGGAVLSCRPPRGPPMHLGKSLKNEDDRGTPTGTRVCNTRWELCDPLQTPPSTVEEIFSARETGVLGGHEREVRQTNDER